MAAPVTYLQPYINLIPGAGVTIDIDTNPDDGDNEITITATGGVGATGPQGNPGPAGADGEDGEYWAIPGTRGADGAAGAAGAAGVSVQGPPGADGDDGEYWTIPGTAGVAGVAGATGPQGPIGQAVFGEDGDDGWPGPPGTAGTTGTTGATGPQGPLGQGVDGIDGDDGWALPGPRGQDGAAGATGPQGPIGQAVFGEDGDDAWFGPQGNTVVGPTGPQGPIGQAVFGEDGDDGWTIPGRVGTDGVAGSIGPQGPIGQAVFGEDGDDGWTVPGPTGPAAVTGTITKGFWFTPEAVVMDGATRSTAGTSPDMYSFVLMAEAAISGFAFDFEVPVDWVAGSAITFDLYYSVNVITPGNFVVAHQRLAVASAADLTGAGAGVVLTTIPEPALANRLAIATGFSLGGAAGTTAGNLIRVQIERRPANAADTSTTSLRVVGVNVNYTATQPVAQTTLSSTEVSLGSTPRRAGSFIVTGLSGLTSGKDVHMIQSNGPYTSKGTRADEAEMDSIQITAKTASATTIQAYWESRWQVKGNYKFNYLVGV